MARSGLISAIERLQIRVADLFESGNIVFLGLVALSAPLVGFPPQARLFRLPLPQSGNIGGLLKAKAPLPGTAETLGVARNGALLREAAQALLWLGKLRSSAGG